jgi:mannose-1-phosphate guanylyltransferase
MKPTSIERETFPAMAKDKELYAMDLEDFWMDIGQPKDYLIGMCLYLNYLKENSKDKENKNIENKIMIDESAKIGNY